jgi:hypothetical protein
MRFLNFNRASFAAFTLRQTYGFSQRAGKKTRLFVRLLFSLSILQWGLLRSIWWASYNLGKKSARALVLLGKNRMNHKTTLESCL